MGMYSETVQCVQCVTVYSVTVYSVTVYSVTVYSTYCAVTKAVIIVIPSDTDRRNKLCLKANGICVKKNSFKKLCVIESINPNIKVGSVILYVNGVHSDNVNKM